MSDPRRLTGLVVVVGGLLWALVATTALDRAVVVPSVGMGFLVAYLATRRYGLLVPGGILTGLGGGLVIAAQGGPGEVVVLGLGLGFVAIAALDAVFGDGEAAWWPMIPGGILTLVGGTQIAGIPDLWNDLLPTALVVVGLLLILRPSARQPSPESSAARRADVRDAEGER